MLLMLLYICVLITYCIYIIMKNNVIKTNYRYQVLISARRINFYVGMRFNYLKCFQPIIDRFTLNECGI